MGSVLAGASQPPFVPLPLTALLCPFVGRLKGGAVVEAKAERDRLTVKLARNRVTKSSTPEGASSEALTDPDPCQSRR